MFKRREFTDGAFYHVTSRTNNKIRVFENNLGRKIMLITLQDAKDKFRFRLANFCVMPTHIHLLIRPCKGTNLSKIMQWIKIGSAKRWNSIHGSIDHLWGRRFFDRAVKDRHEFDFVMDYIDQNPVKAGLSATPAEWKASGAYYRERNVPGLADNTDFDGDGHTEEFTLLPAIPFGISNLFPNSQLDHIMRYYGAYAEPLENLYGMVSKMPNLGMSKNFKTPLVYLHYYTETSDYFMYEYDRAETMYGVFRTNFLPTKTEHSAFRLTELKNIQNIKLDLSWRYQIPISPMVSDAV